MKLQPVFEFKFPVRLKDSSEPYTLYAFRAVGKTREGARARAEAFARERYDVASVH